ncbi:MAG: D-2-hydroxyacid dehydrogenase [Gammaproteobacteria bacterium]|nr:D-2-hydroxyacid dehydrogenase [Gammaproteobacteria bacterium]
MKHQIVFLDRDTIAPGIELRRPEFNHAWVDYPQTYPEQVADRLDGASIAVVNKVPVRKTALEQLSSLRLIAVAATGTDNIDKQVCRQRGVVVCNVRGYAVNTVPEHTFALMLALKKSIHGYRDDVKAGEWQRANQFCFFTHPVSELKGSRLGIVGSGSIGARVGELGRAFGMEVVYAERKGAESVRPGHVSFDEVIEGSDVLSLHCPLTRDTKNMIALPELRRMKSDAFLINTSRGGLVKEEDLVTAIEKKMIGGAAFDVTAKEPPAADHPFMHLLDKPNFILTPHIAWASREAMQTLADQLIDNIESFVSGEPVNVVE